MSDYESVFRTNVALGLGLARRPNPKEDVKTYREDPASAFTRMAALMQPPGGSLPIPFKAELGGSVQTS